MSADNSIARGGRDVDAEAEPVGFQMPPALASRYEMRVIDGPDGEQRIGLFRPTDRGNPSIEISNDRIVARSEDPETVAALVTIAKSSGWERIAVDGSPEFRQAIWKAATREGLTVDGYTPSFDEAARMATLRREDAERRAREDANHDLRTAEKDLVASNTPSTEEAIRPEAGTPAVGETGSSKRSAHDGADLPPAIETSLDAYEASAAEERALVERAFGRMARELEANGDPRAQATRETAAALVEQIYGQPEERAAARSTDAPHTETGPGPATSETPDRNRDSIDQRPAGDPHRRENDELAELFLRGDVGRVAAEPRLAQAVEAQATMEQHIGEVFGGDANAQAAANLESRQMISDALRRGLDVSVREPAPVRQIEPVHSHPDLER